MAMIAVQTGLYTPYVYAGGQPVIPGYYGKDMNTLIPPSVNALPVVREVIRNATLSQVSGNELVVHQTDDKAVIDWESFDIGANAHTRFDQQGNAAWSVLNRIHDSNPSQIYGRLTADGNVYLINSNGFLFSQGARVNVHGLVASALNISVPDFDAGLNVFSSHDSNPDALIVNHGLIQTDNAGSAILLAPHVVNTGTIVSPTGRIILGAGIAANTDPDAQGNLATTAEITSDSNNVVLNESSGQLISDLGFIGLYGSCVNQQGLVRSVSAIKKDGGIILKATDSIITGKDSQTICPISDSDEKVHSSFEFQPGTIKLTSGGTIEHQGLILNPSGTVELTAVDRIYLGENSRIDVGGVTANLAAQDSVVKVTLNSVELKDDQGQKDGILKGEEVAFLAYEGSSIGDVASSLENRDMTAAEKAVTGGKIYLTSNKGDIIAREGSVLDFSGGGTHYASGFADTTWLVSGNKVYSISDAPEWLSYNNILGSYEKNYSRFGITETVNGIYFGGATAVKTRVSDFFMGADAGSLSLYAKTAVLDGVLDGSAMPGLYQIEDGTVTNEFGREFALGLEQPGGGSLIIGKQAIGTESMLTEDAIVSQIVVTSEKETLPEQFTSDSTLADVADSVSLTSEYSSNTNPLYKTVISDDTLSGSGLSNVTLYANTSVTVENGAVISLAPGGVFKAGARTIAVEGQILSPGGEVNLITASNRTNHETIGASANPDYVSLEALGPQRIYLGENAVISTAGETVNNALALEKGETVKSGIEDGGTISLLDRTIENGEGVILRKGSVLDVSGGYEIAMDGSVSGGKAGKISLQGTNLVLDGNLLAWSLPGYSGGTIELFAETVNVVKDTRSTLDESFGVDDSLGESWATGLILGDNTLDNSGLAHLKLNSILDLTVEEGVDLGPSTVKLKNPLGAETAEVDRQLIRMSVDEIGVTSVNLAAGKHMENQKIDNERENKASVIVKEGSRISTTPGGSIVVNGPAIDMGGTFESPGGSISLTADKKNMVLGQNSSLLARGYNKPDAGSTDGSGAVVLEPMDGGTITLSSAGQLTTVQGSLIDVSGADAVTQAIQGTDGKNTRRIIAGNAGSVSMTYGGATDAEGASTLKGTLKASHAAVDGVTGGELFLMKASGIRGQDISSAMITTYLDSGFDSLGFGSGHSLTFTDSMTYDIGRVLTLDAPEIRSSGIAGQTVSLTADTITLKNSIYLKNDTPQALSESSVFSLDGCSIDIQGSMDIYGFRNTKLTALKDIRVSDKYYSENLLTESKDYYGELNVSGDLAITASRIFPTTYSDFTFHSDGKITTRASEVQDETPVYSAGGRLVLEAEEIDHGGVLAAPMGEVVFCGKDNSTVEAASYDQAQSITLQEGSRITTSGDAAVLYGTYNTDGSVWIVNEREGSNSKDIKFEALPEKKVTLAGDTVVSEQGSTIDVSGGGSVFTYLFQKGVEGTVDPLKKSGSYVLLPVSKDATPGEGIYIAGGQGIAEGRYTIMGEEFAFQPGAVIVTDMGTTSNLAVNQMSKAGYPVVIGYESETGQAGHSPIAHAYSLRSAKDVLTEGNYSYKEKTADNGGTLSITANTNTLAAILKGGGKGDALGGILHLTGDDVIIGITDDPTGKLVVAPSSISGSGFSDIAIGDSNTETLTVTSGSKISVNNLDLAAETVTVETGVIMDTGYDKTGTIRITAENGSLDLKAGSVVQAGEALILEGADMALNGSIGVDKGSLTLKSDSIALVNGSETDSPASTGLTIDDEFWAMICGTEALALVSNGAMTLDSGLSIEKEGSLVLDTAVLSVMSDGQTDKTADVTADSLVLKNNGDKNTVAGLPSADPESSLTLTARKNLTVEFADRAEKNETGVSRSITLTGMGETTLAAGQELRLKGQGTLDVTDGNLTLSAQAVTAALAITEKDDGTTRYTTADTLVRVGNGTLRIADGGVFTGDSLYLGGDLGFSALSIDVEGKVILPSGVVSLNATGDENQGIFLKQGSLIDVSGTDVSPAGSIVLSTDHGRIVSDQGSVLDVSAGAEGTAGSLSLTASEQNVDLNGTLASQGTDSRLILDVHGLSDQAFSNVLIKMKDGGFDDTVKIRTRNGDLVVDEDVTVHDLNLAADRGDIRVSENTVIDGSGVSGGSIVLNAGNSLVLESESSLSAAGTAGEGGDVTLTARDGSIQFHESALINVSGSGFSSDGKVMISAGQTNGNSVNAELQGTVRGASSVTVTAVDVNTNVATVDAAVMAAVKQEAVDFMAAASLNNTASTLLAGLKLKDRNDTKLEDVAKTSLFHFAPGIEIQNNGNMTLSTDVDMNGFALTPGTLTLRASGDLTLNNSILSHPTSLEELFTSTARDSWNINLTAGADLSAADVMSFKDSGDSGSLTVRDGAMVYSESGDIRLASRLDTVLGLGKEQFYSVEKGGNYCSVASFDGDITINTGRDLTLNGSAVQNGTGDINVETEGDIRFNTRKVGDTSLTGSIRTTGEAPDSNMGYNNSMISRVSFGFLYHDGGDISIQSGGDISGCPLNKEWNVTSVLTNAEGEKEVHWAAGYGESLSRTKRPPVWTEGIAAMGGGDVNVNSSGSVSCFAGVFGEGDLRVQAGGDLNGRFLVNKGTGKLYTSGSFGTDTVMKDQTLELNDATMSLFAQGFIDLGSVISPSLVNAREDYSISLYTWNPGYTESTSASLTSGYGDISMSGESGFFNTEIMGDPGIESSQHERSLFLPPSLSLDSGNDIHLLGNMILFPSKTGNLNLTAAGSIDGLQSDGFTFSEIILADYDLSRAYTPISDLNNLTYSFNSELREGIGSTEQMKVEYLSTYSNPSNHLNDNQAVIIEAGQDIKNLKLQLPKKAEIVAGQDIVDLRLLGQNLADDDLTLVKAGRDLVFSTAIVKDETGPGIEMAGPGHLAVMAGGKIDLGSSIGITSIGNLMNNAIPTSKGCNILVISGFTDAFDSAPLQTTEYFLDMVRALGVAYTTVLGDEDKEFTLDDIMVEVKKAMAGADDDFLNDVKLAMGDGDGGKYSADDIIDASRSYLKKTLPGYVDPVTKNKLKEGLKKELGDKYVEETTGNIDMVRSQIATKSGGNISIIAAGEFNVGQSVLSNTSGEGTGINAMNIGDINVFAVGDVNVNEARLMSWLGGDISVWSDGGDINAGRGSRTEVNAGVATVVPNPDGTKSVVRSPVAVGSGIRALTFDPDGVEGPQAKPDPGDVYLFAPSGVIDAGEAGIAASNIFLGSRTVLNVQNISFSQGAVGAPTAAENTVNLGAISGAGSLSAATQAGDLSSTLASVNKELEKSAEKMEETFLPSWLRVEFMGFDVNDEGM
jgi:filamentous hemagglutinin family protein